MANKGAGGGGQSEDAVAGSGGAGWSGPILERGSKVLDSYEGLGPPVPYEAKWAWGEDGANQASDNHEAGAWNTETARAAANREELHLQRATAVVLSAYYPRELARGPRAVGLFGRETMCPDNHTHQHLNGTGLGRVAAVESGRPDLLEASEEHTRVTIGAGLAVATPYPQLFACSAGTRSPGERPAYWNLAAFLRQAMGLPGPMPEFERNPGNWRAGMANGVRALRLLQQRAASGAAGGDQFLASLAQSRGRGIKPAGCPVKWPFTVYRRDGVKTLVVMDRPAGDLPAHAEEFCDWAEFPHDARDFRQFQAAIRCGHGWLVRPPDPPRGAVEIRFPATGGR